MNNLYKFKEYVFSTLVYVLNRTGSILLAWFGRFAVGRSFFSPE